MKIANGVGAAVGAAALFGLSTPLAKLLVADVSPLMLAGLLYGGSGVGLACILTARALRDRSSIALPERHALPWLVAAIAIGGALGPYLLLQGLRQTDSASASLILNLEGVFTALLAWMVFGENVDRRIACGMALILAGGVSLSFGPIRASGFAGIALIAAACLAWAIDNNLTRKVAHSDAMLIACTKGLLAGAANVSLALLGGERMPSASTVMSAAVLGFAGYGASLVLFVVALRQLGAARTGAYFSTAPFLGAVLALALGAPMTTALGVCAVLMAAGVWLHLTERHAHLHRHEPTAHSHAHSHDAHHRHAHRFAWDGTEPHSHHHVHEELEHAHAHFPDIHHRHEH